MQSPGASSVAEPSSRVRTTRAGTDRHQIKRRSPFLGAARAGYPREAKLEEVQHARRGHHRADTTSRVAACIHISGGTPTCNGYASSTPSRDVRDSVAAAGPSRSTRETPSGPTDVTTTRTGINL